jgi:hypothetical protein
MREAHMRAPSEASHGGTIVVSCLSCLIGRESRLFGVSY